MRRALFAYFGRMSDTTLNVPGHPLYSLFFLKAIAKRYEVNQFDIFYYDKYECPVIGSYSVLGEQRTEIIRNLVRKDDISMTEAIRNEYDVVFLKYRFRNYSRLSSGSLDRLKFEALAETHASKAVIIDTDAEVAEIYPRVISLFTGNYPYAFQNIAKIDRVIPVLKEDVMRAITDMTIEKRDARITFIGNERGKVGLTGILEELKTKTQTTIAVHGKWNTGYNFIDEVIPRQNRLRGYASLGESVCTLQISKPEYLKFDFMSPRIFEAYLTGTVCFGNNSFMSDFAKFSGVTELSEKIRYLRRSIFTKEYRKILLKEVETVYDNLERQLARIPVS